MPSSTVRRTRVFNRYVRRHFPSRYYEALAWVDDDESFLPEHGARFSAHSVTKFADAVGKCVGAILDRGCGGAVFIVDPSGKRIFLLEIPALPSQPEHQ